MLAVFFTLLPLLTLASAGQLYPPVQVAFSYATPEGQADNHIFTPIPVKISEPGLSYEEDPAMVKAEQAYMMGQYTEQPSVRGVLYFDNNDRPKSFKWSRDQTKYGLKKCDVWVEGNDITDIVWDMKTATTEPRTDLVKVICTEISQ